MCHYQHKPVAIAPENLTSKKKGENRSSKPSPPNIRHLRGPLRSHQLLRDSTCRPPTIPVATLYSSQSRAAPRRRLWSTNVESHATAGACRNDDDQPPPYETVGRLPVPEVTSLTTATARTTTPASGALHPRVAVLLGVNERWHLPLLLCRAISMAPPFHGAFLCLKGLYDVFWDADNPLGAGWGIIEFTELILALLWCGAVAYLSYFFVDCVMSRWLMKYTPFATLIRLISINVLNAYIMSLSLRLLGGLDDPRLLLPIWIIAATTLTLSYHATQRNVNIKRETTTAIRVFWIASFASMCLLLMAQNVARSDVRVPLFVWAKENLLPGH